MSDLQHAARTVAAEVGARLIVLFGSAARGDVRAPEDLDIGVLTRTPLDSIAATNRFMQLLHVSEIDIADLRRADPVLLALVARDGVPLFEEQPGEMMRFRSLAIRRFADTKKFRDAERDALRDAIARSRERT
jgi:predicted nucleotidyltransferase